MYSFWREERQRFLRILEKKWLPLTDSMSDMEYDQSKDQDWSMESNYLMETYGLDVSWRNNIGMQCSSIFMSRRHIRYVPDMHDLD